MNSSGEIEQRAKVNCNKHNAFSAKIKLFMKKISSCCVFLQHWPGWYLGWGQDILVRRLWQWAAAEREVVLAVRWGETPGEAMKGDLAASQQQCDVVETLGTDWAAWQCRNAWEDNDVCLQQEAKSKSGVWGCRRKVTFLRTYRRPQGINRLRSNWKLLYENREWASF